MQNGSGWLLLCGYAKCAALLPIHSTVSVQYNVKCAGKCSACSVQCTVYSVQFELCFALLTVDACYNSPNLGLAPW